MLIGNSMFAVNLPLKCLRATIANADTVSLKSIYKLFDPYLDHMLAKFEPNGGSKILHFLTKRVFLNNILTKS